MADEVFIFTTGSHNVLALYIHEMSEANQESTFLCFNFGGNLLIRYLCILHFGYDLYQTREWKIFSTRVFLEEM